jgi:site-specific DNA-methyltransferase (cytosine-N4-specific)
MKDAFDEATLLRLRKWKAAIQTLSPTLRGIFSLLLLSILEETSYTSKDGQFLRLKKDKDVIDPDTAIYGKVLWAEEDIARVKWLFPSWSGAREFLPKVVHGDVRDMSSVSMSRPPTAIITSPPYANRYDYTRSYCLELCLDFVKNFGELKALRFSMLRSHIESKVDEGDVPAHPVVSEVLQELRHKPLNNPKIPDMLTAYFVDMTLAIKEWGRALAPGARVAMVVDNVRFEGEHVPVDLVLSEIAEEHSFRVKEILVARYKGNSSQQMKKYGRMPVRESVVVWEKNHG